MADVSRIPDEAEVRFFHRHAELVSASMACALYLRGAEGDAGPWTLKQVQGDGVFYG